MNHKSIFEALLIYELSLPNSIAFFIKSILSAVGVLKLLIKSFSCSSEIIPSDSQPEIPISSDLRAF